MCCSPKYAALPCHLADTKRIKVSISPCFHPASAPVAGCFTLFATHFSRLGDLASMYPNARVWHLAVSTGAAAERLTYTRRLQPGAADEQHYGLLLAGAIGIPDEVRVKYCT